MVRNSVFSVKISSLSVSRNARIASKLSASTA
jgi:hypothetical protein